MWGSTIIIYKRNSDRYAKIKYFNDVRHIALDLIISVWLPPFLKMDSPGIALSCTLLKMKLYGIVYYVMVNSLILSVSAGVV